METESPSLASDLLWGGEAIAAELGITRRRAFYLMETGAIPARKLSRNIWVASRAQLRERLLAGEAA